MILGDTPQDGHRHVIAFLPDGTYEMATDVPAEAWDEFLDQAVDVAWSKTDDARDAHPAGKGVSSDDGALVINGPWGDGAA